MTKEEREAARCLHGVIDGTGHGDDWLWLMGYGDWMAEAYLLSNKEEKV